MRYTSLDIRFEGSKFYPSKLKEKTNFPIKVLAEFGEVSSKGRYKGKPSPYGIGVIEIMEFWKQNTIPDLIQEYSTKLLDNNNYLKECGVEDIIFDIESSKDFPAEISLSRDTLQSLSALNARVEFHTIDSNIDDLKNTIDRIKKLNPSIDNNQLYEEILSVLRQHPSIQKADAFSFLMYFFSTNHSYKEVNESLNKFDDFYHEVVKH